ncbi:MAG: ABC transporter substrate-binding protein [Dermatophilaceae bacterium]|nr:ABC transporter substrate-binding protein [Dermatophilaceae bacterium]NUO91570.1 ABC transporter substrate-binding protein [Dermatophilaceae bacterium]NUR15963.1 ABC transporter substrate-binding protein [Dermatophilaceae bacterium]NUR80980.1 ABC transporter substrate-binding protein [Dermatophilaceae bacterium]
MRRMSLFTVTGLVAAGLTLSACGSNSLSSGGSPAAGTGAAPTNQSSDAALVAKLPAKIKSAGKIVVGVDTSYPPNEFLGTDGKTAEGMDIDLFSAVARKFGVQAEFQTASFDSIILGVSSGKYDVGVSSFTINPDRKKQVNMVSYYSAGTLWGVPKGNPKKVDPDNACGLNIGVQKGTTQVDDLTARSKKCTAAGKPAINQIVEDLQVKVNADLASGKVDAMAADSPVTAYAVKQTNGAVETVGKPYDTAPYGYVVPKSESEFAAALADALKGLDTAGDYTKILTKWNVQDGAIHDFAVNP